MKSLIIFATLVMSTAVFASEQSVDLLNDAREIARHEIRDARSGNYSRYRTETLRSILSDIKNSIQEAKSLTSSSVTKDLIDVTSNLIDRESDQSFEISGYRLKTVEGIMLQIEQTLSIAAKYDNR